MKTLTKAKFIVINSLIKISLPHEDSNPKSNISRVISSRVSLLN